MSIIKTHDITLYGGNDIDIVLRPLCDEHLPLLYKWNADPEVTYWLDEEPSSKKDVDSIYSYLSSISYCFLIEADGRLIGDCWLENMNIPEIIEMYPNLDVRRIDLTIGEKDCWGKGVGSSVIGMMTDFAFYGENVDVIHIVAISDNNIRSQKAFMKNGYKFIKAENVDSPRIKQEYHYRFTRQEFIERRRNSSSCGDR